MLGLIIVIAVFSGLTVLAPFVAFNVIENNDTISNRRAIFYIRFSWLCMMGLVILFFALGISDNYDLVGAWITVSLILVVVFFVSGAYVRNKVNKIAMERCPKCHQWHLERVILLNKCKPSMLSTPHYNFTFFKEFNKVCKMQYDEMQAIFYCPLCEFTGDKTRGDGKAIREYHKELSERLVMKDDMKESFTIANDVISEVGRKLSVLPPTKNTQGLYSMYLKVYGKAIQMQMRVMVKLNKWQEMFDILLQATTILSNTNNVFENTDIIDTFLLQIDKLMIEFIEEEPENALVVYGIYSNYLAETHEMVPQSEYPGRYAHDLNRRYPEFVESLEKFEEMMKKMSQNSEESNAEEVGDKDIDAEAIQAEMKEEYQEYFKGLLDSMKG